MAYSIIILAGGRGSRLGGLVPKPLVDLAGRPLVEPVLDQALTSQAEKILIVISSTTLQVRERFSDPRFTYVMKEPTGTADAVQAALDQCDSEYVVIAQADDSYFLPPATFQQLYAFCLEHDAELVMAAELLEYQAAYAFVQFDALTHRLQALHRDAEAVKMPPPKYVATGLYIAKTHWLAEQLPRVGKSHNGERGFPGVIDQGLVQSNNLLVFVLPSGSWVGINTPQEYAHAVELAQQNLDKSAE